MTAKNHSLAINWIKWNDKLIIPQQAQAKTKSQEMFQEEMFQEISRTLGLILDLLHA